MQRPQIPPPQIAQLSTQPQMPSMTQAGTASGQFLASLGQPAVQPQVPGVLESMQNHSMTSMSVGEEPSSRCPIGVGVGCNSNASARSPSCGTGGAAMAFFELGARPEASMVMGHQPHQSQHQPQQQSRECAQKSHYMHVLNEQVGLGVQSVNAQINLQRENILKEADVKKRRYVLDVDRDVHRKMLTIDQEFENHCETIRRDAAEKSRMMTEQAIELAERYHMNQKEEQDRFFNEQQDNFIANTNMAMHQEWENFTTKSQRLQATGKADDGAEGLPCGPRLSQCGASPQAAGQASIGLKASIANLQSCGTTKQQWHGASTPTAGGLGSFGQTGGVQTSTSLGMQMPSSQMPSSAPSGIQGSSGIHTPTMGGLSAGLGLNLQGALNLQGGTGSTNGLNLQGGNGATGLNLQGASGSSSGVSIGTPSMGTATPGRLPPMNFKPPGNPQQQQQQQHQMASNFGLATPPQVVSAVPRPMTGRSSRIIPGVMPWN